MKRLVSSLVILLACGTVSNVLARDLGAVVGPYLKVQETLAADSTTGVREAAALMVTGALALGKGSESLVAASKLLQQANSIASARDAFHEVTVALLEYADATKASLGPGVRRTYCPMEKRTWAQKDGPIANPYAGKRMLRCGQFIDRKG